VKILLTGATGFLGSHLVHAFLEEGHQVAIIKRSTSNTERIYSVLGDMETFDIDRLAMEAPFLKLGGVDAVIHTATCYGKDGETNSEIYETNTLFPLKLLETAISFNTKTFFNTDTFFNKDHIL